MPFTDSVALLNYMFALRPKQKVLILTMSREEVYAKRFLKLGVKGFINKEADRSEIRKAIVCILNNKRYLSSRMQDTLSSEILDEGRLPSSCHSHHKYVEDFDFFWCQGWHCSMKFSSCFVGNWLRRDWN